MTRPGNGIAISGDTLWVIDGQGVEAIDEHGAYLTSTPRDLMLYDAYSLVSTDHGLLIAKIAYVDGHVLRLEPTLYNASTHTATRGFSLRYTLIESTTGRLTPRQSAPVPLPDLFYDVARNGDIYLTVGDSFHVRRLGFDGQIRGSYVADVPRRRVTARDIEDYASSQLTKISSIRPPNEDVASIREDESQYLRSLHGHPKATYREAIRQLIVSDVGTMLLRRSDVIDRPYKTNDNAAVAEWTWIDAVGQPIARLILPAAFTPKVFKGCDLYGTSTDDDGSPLVHHYALDQHACGGE